MSETVEMSAPADDADDLPMVIEGLPKRADTVGEYGTADYGVVLVRPGVEDCEVASMFDETGSETFDPTSAVEIVDGDGAMVPLKVGDRLLMGVQFTA